MKKLLLLLALVLSSTLLSCSDDPVAVDPNIGRKATYIAFYAHPDEPASSLNVSVDDSVGVSALTYGTYAYGKGQVGANKKIRFQGLSGTEFATTNEVNLDTGRSVIAVYTGLGTSAEDEAFAVSTPYGPKLGANLAGVRFVHASKNAGIVKVFLNVAAGPTMTNIVDYRGSNNAFTQIGVSTTALVVANEDGSTTFATLDLTGANALEAGKRYTVVLYGNAASGATTNKLTLAVVPDPVD